MYRRVGFWVMGSVTAGLLVTGVGAPVTAAPPPPPVIATVQPDHGPVTAGQVVTVTGGVFVDGETYVRLGEEWLTATVQSPSALTFVVPARAAGRFELRIAVGDEESAPAIYTVTAPPVVIPSPTPSGDAEVVESDDPPAGLPEPSATPRVDRPVVAREVPKAPAPPELAATGSRASWSAQHGLVALLTGAALVGLARNRKPRPVERGREPS